MHRPRLVHGLSSAAGEVQPPLTTPDPEPGHDPGRSSVPAGTPGLSAVAAGGGLRQVQMENIHPLRLRILMEIERTGSISAAAESCGIGQPSASMHLRTLEAATGKKLVMRTGRGSSLTPGGRIVASHAARVLATLESMQGALDTLNSHGSGELIIAASLTPTISLIPPTLRRFSDRYPGVTIRLRTAPSEVVIREVSRSAAAIGIAGEVASEEAVVRRQIMMDELIGIAPGGLLSTEGGFVSPDVLARHSLLLGAEGSSTRQVTERHLARAACRPASVWEFDSYEAIKRAVADGLGVSFLSQLLVRDEIERRELVPFRLVGVVQMVRPIHVVHSSVAELTPQAAAFMALLTDADPIASIWEQPVDRVAESGGISNPTRSGRHWMRRLSGE